NAQAGALGFWLRHKHYKNAVLLTQSQGARFGGAGIIANGRLLEGSHRIAGEIKYILRRFYGLTIRETHSVSMEEMLETTDLYARCLISIIDPEIILVRNMMIPDIEMLRESLLKTIPGRILPKLRKISDSDALEYMLLGIMARCMEEA
ncbi:MAG: ROK family protein, partial [Lachnospiraceae bacterium]|nr:ROK family protein [Lachnospiraceae bacterium]